MTLHPCQIAAVSPVRMLNSGLTARGTGVKVLYSNSPESLKYRQNDLPSNPEIIATLDAGYYLAGGIPISGTPIRVYMYHLNNVGSDLEFLVMVGNSGTQTIDVVANGYGADHSGNHFDNAQEAASNAWEWYLYRRGTEQVLFSVGPGEIAAAALTVPAGKVGVLIMELRAVNQADGSPASDADLFLAAMQATIAGTTIVPAPHQYTQQQVNFGGCSGTVPYGDIRFGQVVRGVWEVGDIHIPIDHVLGQNEYVEIGARAACDPFGVPMVPGELLWGYDWTFGSGTQVWCYGSYPFLYRFDITWRNTVSFEREGRTYLQLNPELSPESNYMFLTELSGASRAFSPICRVPASASEGWPVHSVLVPANSSVVTRLETAIPGGGSGHVRLILV
ncbi:hypothetical protein [Caldinitratiruptor microaerophilus]|uniref:Uncharacterized protein n=1 Tax=Caldinitratiruptor microaerophilus TaxID=671077 RepID=A0AA35CQE4_9FIRM|nr:hypothetical protein [Caldinitratiruptor microaerophilus]BDG61915.1 hypothetical protein caldi_30050 [Caldinitratiruptor microaerophilus]